MREEILAILRSKDNPLWSCIAVCYTMDPHNFSSHHKLYGKVHYHLTKLEKDGLLYVFRHQNQGTTYLLKSRVKTNPFTERANGQF